MRIPSNTSTLQLARATGAQQLIITGALPTGKNKQRKTSASKQDGSDSELREGGSSDQLFVAEPVAAKYVKRTTVRARKSEPVKRATKADEEYEEDQGRMESQYVFACPFVFHLVAFEAAL